MSFTKGKWEKVPLRNGDCDILSGVETIACVFKEYVATKEEAKANARLIAAAPDLYATIENALTTLKIMSIPMTDKNVATNDKLLKITCDSFREALAKADK